MTSTEQITRFLNLTYNSEDKHLVYSILHHVANPVDCSKDDQANLQIIIKVKRFNKNSPPLTYQRALTAPVALLQTI